MFNTYFIIVVYLLSKYLCHICSFNREIEPTSNNCNGKAAIKFILQAVKYACIIFSGNSGRINRPKTDIKVTIPVIIKSEIAKIVCSLLFLSIGNLKANFFATGPTITVAKKLAFKLPIDRNNKLQTI